MKPSFLVSHRRLLLRLTFALLGAAGPGFAHAQDTDVPHNLGRGLRPLVEWQRTQPAARTDAERQTALRARLGHNPERVQTDGAGRVTVEVRLDGTVPADEVKKNLAALGVILTSEHLARRADGRDGVLAAHLPLAQAEAAARVPGVFSVLVAHGPRTRVGKVTSQGVAALHADAVQSAGYTGAGIMIGVLSDSYNVATATSVSEDYAVPTSSSYAPSTTAAQDIASGDLPAAGVIVLADDPDPNDDEATDEGRAMLQIIHDVAPGAALAFHTAGETQTDFALNVKDFRTNPNVYPDILVDDIGYGDEPFFSDGIASEAVDEVVTSTTLAGHPVLYYSAAGNDGDLSYEADFNPVTDAFGRAHAEQVHIEQVPDNLTAGGFHNFKAADVGHGHKVVQKVTVSGADASIDFQWNDPFVPGKITSDYNLLVFDANGNYQPGSSDPNATVYSGIDNNFSTGEAVEFVGLPLNKDGSDTTYYLVISKTSQGTGTAQHLRYIVEDSGTVTGKYLRTAQPTIYGHSAAADADGIAAYDVHDLSTAEYYESFGPVTIYFDDNGNRLATPIVRQQPTLAAVDGVDTTFFPEGPVTGDDSEDSDGNGFPNFYGTSAAAPHAAGVAALLLQAAGGKQSLSAAQMRSLLESTAASHDLNPAESIATFASADGLFNVTLTAMGDASNNSAFDQKFFTLTYTGPTGSSLTKAVIDIGSTDEDFDETLDNGFPFTVGQAINVDTTDLTTQLATGGDNVSNSHLTLKLPTGAFPTGGTLAFGIDRDDASLKPPSGGNDADLLAGATVKIKFTLTDGTKDKAVGTLANKTGTGYSPDVGYGLINADAALIKLGK